MAGALDDQLIGRRRITFVNGAYQLVNVVNVYHLGDGTPLVLLDDKGNTYPWVNIRKIGPRRN